VRRTVAVALGIGTIAVLAVAGYLLLWTGTTIVHVGPVSAVADLIVGLLWLTSSLAVLLGRPGNRTGWLLLLAGVLWFAQAARMSSNGWLFTIGIGLLGSHLAVALHIALALPDGQLRDRSARMLVAATYGTLLLLALGKLMARSVCDGYLPECPGSQLQVEELTAHRNTLELIRLYVLGILTATGFVMLVQRLRRSDPVTRRTIAPLLVAGVATVPVFVVAGIIDIPPKTSSTIIAGYLLAGLPPLAVVAGLAWARMRRTEVGPLVLALDQGLGADGLRDALARCLGDPNLVVAFPDGAGGYVDGDGRPFRPSSDGGRVSTPVARDGRTVALLEHHSALRDDPQLLDSAVAASRLALDNARLTAQVRAQLTELKASRHRLANAVDAGRRRLERDLHDGAQQQLLAVAIDLARAQDAARHGHHSILEKLLTETGERLDEAMTELRRLARGIHPPILTERGLPAAVEALAGRAPLPVELHGTCARLPPAVEATAYFVVTEALTNAVRHAHADYVSVHLDRQDDLLVVEVRDDGRGGATLHDTGGLQGLTDRVAAEDGQLTVSSHPGQGTVVRAALPLPPATDTTTPREEP
jgi:signal transduction histidine kinase